ncbi:17249_t:CDS:2, partial [Funneliformis caledonium]
NSFNDNKNSKVIIGILIVVGSFILVSFVLGLRKAQGNIPKYLILFLLAFICPPLCVFIIRGDLKKDSWVQKIFTVLTCDYCCGLFDPNSMINLILTTCYLPAVLHALYHLFSVIEDF